MVAGTRIIRTTVASTRTATARPRPNVLMIGSSPSTNDEKIKTMMVAAAVMTRPVRRRRAILARPFPAEWSVVLEREVVFYRVLEPGERERAERGGC